MISYKLHGKPNIFSVGYKKTKEKEADTFYLNDNKVSVNLSNNYECTTRK